MTPVLPLYRQPTARSRPTTAAVLLTALLATLAVLTACGDNATDAERSRDLALQVISGDSQIGPAYEELPDPIVVRVVNAVTGTPEGQIVNFRVVEGGGSVFGGAAQTNAQGLALDYWTLGAPGPQRIEARAVRSDGEKLVFGSVSATAVAPFDSMPAAIQCMDSTATWVFPGACGPGPGPVGSSIPMLFRVVNADSLPIPDVTMWFSVWASVPDSINHPGVVVPSEAATDSVGVVPVLWTLDSLRGMYALEAQVQPPVGQRLWHSLYVPCTCWPTSRTPVPVRFSVWIPVARGGPAGRARSRRSPCGRPFP